MTARSLLDRTGTFLGLILVAIIFGVLVGQQFFAPANVELMARQTAIVCMAALGMTVVIATGGIDLSVGSIIALSTVVIALMLRMDVNAAAGGARRRGAAALCGLRQRRPHHAAARRARSSSRSGRCWSCAARRKASPTSAASRRRSPG